MFHRQGATHRSHERISESPAYPAACKFTEEGTSDNKGLWQRMNSSCFWRENSEASIEVCSLDDLERNLIEICPARVAILTRRFKDYAGLQHLLRAEDNVIEHIDLSRILSPEEALFEMVITSVSSLGLCLSSKGVTALNEAVGTAIQNNRPIKLKTLVLGTKPDSDISKLAITKHIERLMICGISCHGIDQLLSDPTCKIWDLSIDTINAEWITDVIHKGRSLRKLGLRVYYSTPIEFLTNPKCTLDGLEMRIDNTKHDLQEIASAITRCQLSFLALELFYICPTKEDIEVILKAVQTAPCITHFVLQGVYFPRGIIPRMEEFLTNPDCKLKGFGWRGNRDASFQETILNKLITNYKILELDLPWASNELKTKWLGLQQRNIAVQKSPIKYKFERGKLALMFSNTLQQCEIFNVGCQRARIHMFPDGRTEIHVLSDEEWSKEFSAMDYEIQFENLMAICCQGGSGGDSGRTTSDQNGSGDGQDAQQNQEQEEQNNKGIDTEQSDGKDDEDDKNDRNNRKHIAEERTEQSMKEFTVEVHFEGTDNKGRLIKGKPTQAVFPRMLLTFKHYKTDCPTLNVQVHVSYQIASGKETGPIHDKFFVKFKPKDNDGSTSITDKPKLKNVQNINKMEKFSKRFEMGNEFNIGGTVGKNLYILDAKGQGGYKRNTLTGSSTEEQISRDVLHLEDSQLIIKSLNDRAVEQFGFMAHNPKLEVTQLDKNMLDKYISEADEVSLECEADYNLLNHHEETLHPYKLTVGRDVIFFDDEGRLQPFTRTTKYFLEIKHKINWNMYENGHKMIWKKMENEFMDGILKRGNIVPPKEFEEFHNLCEQVQALHAKKKDPSNSNQGQLVQFITNRDQPSASEIPERSTAWLQWWS